MTENKLTHFDADGKAVMVEVGGKAPTQRVAVAALTIYDMCKAVDRAMVIGDIRLMEKRGGKSGSFVRDGAVERE